MRDFYTQNNDSSRRHEQASVNITPKDAELLLPMYHATVQSVDALEAFMPQANPMPTAPEVRIAPAMQYVEPVVAAEAPIASVTHLDAARRNVAAQFPATDQENANFYKASGF